MITEKRETLKNSVSHFLIDWHSFPIDYWWRKRYGVAFGSRAHREMNFIDMLIEWQEELELNQFNISNPNDGWTDEDYENLGLNGEKGEPLSQKEIDEDYENLDLTEFDKK